MHTKSVARLVMVRIGLKNNNKSVARLVDSENWSKKNKIKKNTHTQKVLLDWSIVRIGLKKKF